MTTQQTPVQTTPLSIEALLQQETIEQAPQLSTAPVFQIFYNSPAHLMHHAEFAKQIGLSANIVKAWIAQDYIPTVKVGKYRLINLVKLSSTLEAA